MRTILLATTCLGAVCLATAAIAADAAVRKTAPAPPAAVVERVQDCSAFYDPYHSRGFGWGSGPGLGVGFGTFEGALPMYPSNSFPNWYGDCVTWGRYSATGSAPQ
jgi:hypothetical protein